MGKEEVYKCKVTKSGKTETWWLCLPLNMINDHVQQAYDEGAEAVELEWMPNITREQFHDRLPKPY
jgi:hypothetical protein